MKAQSLLSPLRVMAIVAVMVVSGKRLLSPAHTLTANGFDQLVSAPESGRSPADRRFGPNEAAVDAAQGSAEME